MTHKLLLADDSVTIQRVVELTFSGEDVQVVSVGDGEQAIARIPVELPDTSSPISACRSGADTTWRPSSKGGPISHTSRCDNLVDEVTRRVVERLAPEAANELVARIVSEVAERLIREEITRIKAAAAARL